MQKTFCEICFKDETVLPWLRGFFLNKILLILVAGFTKTTEQTFKQIQLNNKKLSRLLIWINGLIKLSSTLAAGSY